MFDLTAKYFPDQRASWTIVANGLGLTAGTLVAGRLVDRYRRLCTQLYLMAGGLWYSALLIAATPTLFTHIHSFVTPILINLIIGFGNGGQAALYYVSIVSVVATEDIAQAVGISSAVCGTTFLAGGALGGWLVDAYGSYGVAFLAAGALGQFGSILFFFVSAERQMSLSSSASD